MLGVLQHQQVNHGKKLFAIVPQAIVMKNKALSA